ncbi:hypothetical protein OAV47_01925 [bacterium]|nr:hypothetical protein [bacterium]
MRAKVRTTRGLAALTAAALAAALSTGCAGLGASSDSVKSVRLVNQMNRINVEADRSEEKVEQMLARLQPALIRQGRSDAAQARELLGAATEACQQQARQLERHLPGLDQEGSSFFEQRRLALGGIEDPDLRRAAAAELEVDLERFLEYQASAVAALDAYDELNLELGEILAALPEQPKPDALTDDAVDLRNQAWSLRMILEDCKRAAGAFDVR